MVQEKENTPKENLLRSRLQQLCLMDDIFMSKCFEDNNKATEIVLREILKDKSLQVHKVQTQYALKNLDGHSAVLDIYATDAEGKQYNIEIQQQNDPALSQRARYYASMLDSHALEKNTTFENLPECYTIFITKKDILKKNLPLYHVERMFQEVKAKFNDGSHIIYVNAANKDGSPLGKLMHDFSCPNPEEMFYPELADVVLHYKYTEEGGRTMCGVFEEFRKQDREEGRLAGLTEGRLAGKVDGKLEAATNMLKCGKLTQEEIASIVDLPLKDIKALADKVK